jgi:fructokinase
MNRKVFTIGESLLDIIFVNDESATVSVGGSLLNTSISLAKSGNSVSLISETGNDYAGKLILNSLKSSGIDTSNIQIYDNNQTAVALAFLDMNRNADYNFYKNYPQKRFLSIPQINQEDILMFGSVYAITDELRDSINIILKEARQKNAMIYYDPNIRKHCNSDDLKPYFFENITNADIIKASNEDIFNIFGDIGFEEFYNVICRYGCKNLIITQNRNPVMLFTENNRMEVKIPEIKVVSSIGAGDAFNAGVVHQILKNNISREQISDLNSDNWTKIINTAINFASDVCKNYQNFISDKLANKITNYQE